MTHEEMQALLAKPNNAIVGANRREGAPQLTVVWFYWDGTSFYFSTKKDRAKYPNLKRDPSLSLIIDDPESHRYVIAYGKAEIIEHDFADLARPLIKKYVPPERAEQIIHEIINDPQRVIVVLHPDKFLTN